MSKTLYTAHVHTIGGREGAAKSSDNQLDVRLSKPGTNRPGTNPEQLFAAGWSACFEGALGLAAKEAGVVGRTSTTGAVPSCIFSPIHTSSPTSMGSTSTSSM